MERRLQMIERNDFQAEPLSEILSLDDDEGDTMRAVINAQGHLEAVRIGKKIALPENTEQLRSRIALLGASWTMAGYIQTHRPYLKNLTPSILGTLRGVLVG